MDLAELQHHSERLLKAMANRHRLMILCELYKGERSVSALNQRLASSLSALSQHLARLRADGLVKTRRNAQSIHSALEGTTTERFIATLSEIYCPVGSE